MPPNRAHLGYRLILKKEFESRKKADPALSLRGFALLLQMPPGQLSRVLNKKGHLSLAKAEVIALRVFSNPQKRKHFLNLFKNEVMLGKENHSQNKASNHAETLDLDQAAVEIESMKIDPISNWYCIPLFESLGIPHLKGDLQKVSSFLDIPEQTVFKTLLEFEKLGLATRISETRWKRNHTAVSIGSNMPSQAIKNFHKQMIVKAQRSIDDQDMKKRVVTGLTFPINSKLVPVVKNLIEDFFNNLANIVDQCENPDQLFQTNLQFFELGRPIAEPKPTHQSAIATEPKANLEQNRVNLVRGNS